MYDYYVRINSEYSMTFSLLKKFEVTVSGSSTSIATNRYIIARRDLSVNRFTIGDSLCHLWMYGSRC